ncbi:MAG: ROK family protein [Planctomycetes bacterium]|nr:ROK family protein [Planctomycetota bacterium]
MQESRIFAIDFSHEEMTAAFVAADGTADGAAGLGLADLMTDDGQSLDKMVAMLTAKARTAGAGIAAAMLTLPCDLDKERRTVVSFPEAALLNGHALPEILRHALGIPVYMERKAVAQLTYDCAMLGLPEQSMVVGCYIDRRYDSAIWHCGRVIVGRNGTAGTVGHITIQDREDVCFCGKTGCVNLYGAGIRLNQIHDMIFSDIPMRELFQRHGDHPIIQDYLNMMAFPIAMEGNILDPDFMVLGGGIPSLPGFPRQYLEDAIRRHGYHPVEDHAAAFLPSAAGTTPGVIVAAQYAFTALSL